MKWLYDLISNEYLIIGVSSWLIAQLLKTVLHAVVNRKLDMWRLVGDGGMPSGHLGCGRKCPCLRTRLLRMCHKRRSCHHRLSRCLRSKTGDRKAGGSFKRDLRAYKQPLYRQAFGRGKA